MAPPSADTVRLVKYLIDAMPSSLHAKSSDGTTPLQLAFCLHRFSIAKSLIASGADQTCRNHAGNNLIHSLLLNSSVRHTEPDSQSGIALQQTYHKELIELIDPRIRQSMFTERCSHNPGAVTPLHRWLCTSNTTPYYYYNTTSRGQNTNYNNDNPKETAVLKTLLEFSDGEELGLINAAGDTPVHTAVSHQTVELLKMMLDRNPELVNRENAVGRTPLEVAQDVMVARKFEGPPQLPRDEYGQLRSRYQPLVEQSPESSVEEKGKKVERDERREVLEVCLAAARRSSGKRRLVRLVEANEVARRVASRSSAGESGVGRGGVVRDEEGEEEEVVEASRFKDEVEKWFGEAAGWYEEREVEQ